MPRNELALAVRRLGRIAVKMSETLVWFGESFGSVQDNILQFAETHDENPEAVAAEFAELSAEHPDWGWLDVLVYMEVEREDA